MNIILEAVVGSTAHGLAGPDSDKDVAGIFVRPTVEFSLIGYQQANDTIHKVSPTVDYTYHEVGKFLSQVVKGSPTILDLIYAENFLVRESLAEPILNESNLTQILSHDRVYNAYYGMIGNNIKKAMLEDHDGKVFRKQIRHAVRLSRQAESFLFEGTYRVKETDFRLYNDLQAMPMGKAIDAAKGFFKHLQKMNNNPAIYHYLNDITIDVSIERANEVLMSIRSLA